MNKSDFVVWDALAGQTFVSLEGLQNVENVFELKRGISRSVNFPDNAMFCMNRNFPKKNKLADCVVNFEKITIASKRSRNLLEAKSAKDVEFLPIKIFNHEGKLASSEHMIVNALKVVDCIDQTKSSLSWNKIDNEYISFVDKLVLDVSKISADDVLIRPKHLAAVILMRKDIAEAFDEAGISGTQFIPVEEFEI